ncbi:type II secretion system minor pseudopilin [Marinicella gelatinilytica]|uniref:general secretion pathway protein GspK n=1 Tax=Marinicella gelatinilytica TaxID=2996017 RepID=UPI002260927D|nr:type II secretion system protein GspK [Marinicella gelatinilytica]MCX7544082.1 type II secretion system protein GspK [Marinicella gelatinilytica]
MSSVSGYKKQQGIALVLVLWVALLMTVIAGSFALSARTESVQSRILFNQVQAEFLAEAGLNRAVFELRNPDPETRWIADGRPYEFTMNEAKISVQITDESGKIDLNLANEELLVGLFASVGVEFDEALALSDKIQDWRDPDEEVRLAGAEDADYFAAGYAHGAKDAPFDTVPELLQVMGIDYALYRKIEPAITVYSGRGNLNLAFAPKEALMALDGINAQMAEDYVNQRHEIFDMGAELPILLEGQSGSLRSGSTTFSIIAKATLPNEQWAELDATIRLGGNVRGRPFQIIRWRDNKNK